MSVHGHPGAGSLRRPRITSRWEVRPLTDTRRRLLLLSMYPLDQGVWGPTNRIRHLRDELARLVELDVIAGYRGERRGALAQYAISGRLRGLRGIYVESSSFLPAELDLALLGLGRALGVRVLTYIRDAYQLFPQLYQRSSLRTRLGAAAFRPMTAALRAVSWQVAFPTRGLASAVAPDIADPVLLPPGSPNPVRVSRDADADQVLFVGSAREPAQGTEQLAAAVALARERGSAIGLTVVCRPGHEPPAPHPEWLNIRHAEAEEIHALLPRVVATVIPRPRTAYNDLALPIKLFDYLAYGRPLLVTDCAEQARVVRQAECGVVVGDSPAALASGLVRLCSADPDVWRIWSENAHRAASVNGWAQRANVIANLLLRDEDEARLSAT